MARDVRRLLTVHRSPAGPARDMFLCGRVACRRCVSLRIGLVAGLLVGGLVVLTVPSPRWWLVPMLALPAVVDAVREKFLGGVHRPTQLMCANLLLGLGLGLGVWGALAGMATWLLIPLAVALRFGVPPALKTIARAAPRQPDPAQGGVGT